jgi:hypothetical protein
MQKKGLRVGVTKPEEDGLRQLGGLPRVHEIQFRDELLQNSYTGQFGRRLLGRHLPAWLAIWERSRLGTT